MEGWADEPRWRAIRQVLAFLPAIAPESPSQAVDALIGAIGVLVADGILTGSLNDKSHATIVEAVDESIKGFRDPMRSDMLGAMVDVMALGAEMAHEAGIDVKIDAPDKPTRH